MQTFSGYCFPSACLAPGPPGAVTASLCELGKSNLSAVMQPQRHRALATEPCLCAKKRWLCSRQRAPQEGEPDLSPSTRHLCEAKTYPAYARSHLAPLGPQVIICDCQLSRKRSIMVSLKGIFWAFLLSPACILMGPDSGFMSSYQENSFLCIQLSLCIAHFAKWQGWICHNRSQTKWWSPARVCGASSFHARTLW